MIRRLLPAFALIALAVPALADDARSLPTSIDGVTVYSDRAIVTRKGRIDLAPGVHELRLDGLPASASRDSLRGRVEAAEGAARLLTVEGEVVRLEATDRPDVRAAREAVDAAHAKARDAALAVEESRARHALALSAADAATDSVARQLGSGGDVVLDRLLQARDFAAKQAGKLRATLVADIEAQRKADEALATAKARLQQISASGDRLRTAATLTVVVDSKTQLDVHLAYTVRGAGWAPTYAVRASEDYGSVGIDVSGRVWQSTGEDWDGVSLELSTAQPMLGAAPPEPSRWTVGLVRPSDYEDDGAVVAESVAMDAAPATKAMPKEAQVRRSGVSIAFVAPERSRVRSDGRPHRVSLASYPLAADPYWVTVPAQSERVFVATELVNSTGTPFPAGEVTVFVGPDHVGRTSIPDWNPDEPLEFGLGVDPNVDVEREVLANASGAEGWIDEQRVHRRDFRITLGNHRSRALEIRVRDRLPVSRDARIVVEEFRTSLTPHTPADKADAERDTARGFLEWRLPVPAGGTTELRFGFDVRHPEDWSVDGL